MVLVNKAYMKKTKKQRADIFAKQVNKIVLNDKKHFILLYEANSNPSKSYWSFDCSQLSAYELVGLVKQILISIIKEKKIKTD